MTKLSVNVDHVATIRQARRGDRPDPVTAAMIAELAGANGITVHLREDRRHIQDRDLSLLRSMVKSVLNMEMAATAEMLAIAVRIKPDMVTIVPEKREELTTEGGLNLLSDITGEQVRLAVETLRQAGIHVNLFLDPDLAQIARAGEIFSNGIEIHTGRYADAVKQEVRDKEFQRIVGATKKASRLGMAVHAGHGLDYWNVARVANIEEIVELAIGFSIVSRSIFTGLGDAVKEMLALVR